VLNIQSSCYDAARNNRYEARQIHSDYYRPFRFTVYTLCSLSLYGHSPIFNFLAVLWLCICYRFFVFFVLLCKRLVLTQYYIKTCSRRKVITIFGLFYIHFYSTSSSGARVTQTDNGRSKQLWICSRTWHATLPSQSSLRRIKYR
jgi:hypothetical protein